MDDLDFARSRLRRAFDDTVGEPPPGVERRVLSLPDARENSSSRTPIMTVALAAILTVAVVATLIGTHLLVRQAVSVRPGTQVTPPASPSTAVPPGRWDAAAAYDSSGHVLLVFGGSQGSNLSDTWLWDGSSWRQADPAQSPPAAARIAVGYDQAHGQIVLLGPGGGQTWIWDGQNWSQRFPGNSPPWSSSSGTGGVLVYFPELHRLVFVGGPNGKGTWGWDGQTWTDLKPGGALPDGVWQPGAVAYSPKRHALTAVSPTKDGYALWTYDGRTWNRAQVGPPPDHPDFNAALAYDPGHDQWLLFGGDSTPAGGPGTDVLTGTAWKHVQSAPEPARRLGAVAWDSDHSRLLTFGGNGGGQYLADLWAWNGSTWTRLAG